MRDRVLPAHRDPRRHRGQPRRGGGRSSELLGPDVDLVLVESGGDNLTATFSYGLVDRQIFVLDVAGGDKVPRKGGPGVTRSDLLVVNKTDLAPLVGADVGRMLADADRVRDGRPVLSTAIRSGDGVGAVAAWVMDQHGATR